MEKVRLGIVGVGVQGSTYVKFLTGELCPEKACLGALCDVDPAAAEKCAKEHPDVPFYSDYKELIASGNVDAIITTVPHYFHTEMAIYAMEHGMNVLVEKPAGVRSSDVMKMNECAAKHPEVAFGIMFNQRTNKLYQRIRDVVQSGELGELRRTSWIINSWWRPDSYYKQSEWRATWGLEGGGVLVNQAPHQLDLWQWICGIPNKVYATIVNGAHRDIVTDNDVTILTKYPNGATGSFITCTHDPAGTDRLEIDLTKGKIVVEGSKKATIMRFAKSEDEMNSTMTMKEVHELTSGNSAGGGLYEEETFEHEDKWGMQHTTVIDNFTRHIVDGTPLLAPGADGINGVNLANAAYLSSWIGEEVDLPCDTERYNAELNKRIIEEGKYPTR